MPRPCRLLHAETLPSCHACRMYSESPAFRALCDAQPAPPATPYAPPPAGPGSELKALLASLGVPACTVGCGGYAALMDSWGVEGCRRRREEVAARLREQAAKAGWAAKLRAAALAAAQGLVFNPLDPYGSLVDEAIRRAEGRQGRPFAPPGEKPP